MPVSTASGKTFRDMFAYNNGAGKTVHVVFDEADNLARQPTDTIACFLQELRELQQHKSALRGVALLGTHKLLDIVNHRKWSPSHHISPFNAVRGDFTQLICLPNKLTM